MRGSTQQLFAKPRATSRKLMHVYDAGINCSGLTEGSFLVQFKCWHCGLESGWQKCEKISVAKRGIPCPNCN